MSKILQAVMERPPWMNSKLRNEESWWNSNSSAFRDGLDSFRKKMESSFQKLAPYQKRRKSIDHHDDDETCSPRSDEPIPRRNKSVRFKKFDTVFPFKSFSRLQKCHSDDEAETNHHQSIQSNVEFKTILNSRRTNLLAINIHNSRGISNSYKSIENPMHYLVLIGIDLWPTNGIVWYKTNLVAILDMHAVYCSTPRTESIICSSNTPELY